jgi:hypothetical protein
VTATGTRHYSGNALSRSSQTVAPIPVGDCATKLCPVCRSPLPAAAPTGRPRRYCSPRCRQEAAEHRRLVEQVAWADAAIMRERVDAPRARPYTRQPQDAVERACSRCGARLPLSAFRLIRGRPPSWCRACAVERTRQWRAEHRDTLNARRRDTAPRYCAACGGSLAKRPGPGRWPRYCPTCRKAGRAAAQAAYRAAHREQRAAAERERRRARAT